MKFRIITDKLIPSEPEGENVLFFEGYCDDEYYKADKLPKEGICEGSNVIITDTGEWRFFNEKTQTYMLRVTLEG